MLDHMTENFATQMLTRDLFRSLLLWNVNRKSQVADRYVSIVMTLKGM